MYHPCSYIDKSLNDPDFVVESKPCKKGSFDYLFMFFSRMSSISACILLSLAALILLGQPGRGASFLGVGRGRARPAGGRFGMNRVAAAGNGAAMKPFFQGRQVWFFHLISHLNWSENQC